MVVTTSEYQEARKRMESCKTDQDWCLNGILIVDDYMRQDALAKLDERASVFSREVQKYLSATCRFMYGSEEVSALLTHLKCYDDGLKVAAKGA